MKLVSYLSSKPLSKQADEVNFLISIFISNNWHIIKKKDEVLAIKSIPDIAIANHIHTGISGYFKNIQFDLSILIVNLTD